ncbi:SIR2 family NAD-dependent protein deacylase [Pelobacter propionicus]|uniref:protein acetyllysine N-acetyltransferase n=1 Tax=Pelobacter propionicus (strain DSM 2379 / NBRC 103807 / OttBd1) TaxID=338966 RepID=A1AML5_PELPD|nr:Sir2 family NAD-dependent protein deacetylase [Pelobacter propionicus]ABK98585.1 Silent information regulator protein Sir2 [Pelobacter propionicus DSM 2379]
MHPLEPVACAELIRNSKSMVALTGAGISTAAGIPDFRGPKGLYVTRRYDPELVFEIDNFQRAPQYFYEFTSDFATAVRDVAPTFTHRFLAQQEQAGQLEGVITQNIDILHQMAGSRNVLELHGSYRSATCQSCRTRLHELDYPWWIDAMAGSSHPPVVHCPSCDGLLKPDIVFFGEAVNGFGRAEAMVAACDLLLVLGSSLNVTPASLLPYSTSAPTVIVNRGSVMLPPAPNRYFVDEDLDDYFTKVADHVRR